MRPKFSVWSDYGTPTRRHWMSASKRGTRPSIGPTILLAAVVVVAGVIGISGIYPQVIDPEWAQETPTHPPKMSPTTTNTTTRRSGIVATIPLPPRRPAPELSQLSATVAAAEPPEEAATPPAEIPDAQAKTDAVPPEPAPAVASKPAKKSRAVVVMAKKKVARVEHHQRGYSGAYAQYGGWGGWGGGWPGFSPSGNVRRF